MRRPRIRPKRRKRSKAKPPQGGFCFILILIPCGNQSCTPAMYVCLPKEIAMFSKNSPKIDKPDEVAFAREIAKNIPGRQETEQMWEELSLAYIASKAYRGVTRKK